MRILGVFIFALMGVSTASGQQQVPGLYPGPENPYFQEFLFPDSAFEFFQAAPESPSAQLAERHLQKNILPFFAELGDAESQRNYINLMLLSWDDELRLEFLPKDQEGRTWVDSLDPDSANWPAEQKAVLSSIFGLSALRDLRLPSHEYQIEILSRFEADIETSAEKIVRLFQIDADYLEEKIKEVEALKPEAKLNDYASIANLLLAIREEERQAAGWGSEERKAAILESFLQTPLWGEIEDEHLRQIDQHTWQSLQARYEEQSEEAWKAGLWNPFRADASLTRSPLLVATGLGLRQLTRWARVSVAPAQSLELFMRQLQRTSGLSEAQLRSWVQDPSRAIFPKDLKSNHSQLLKRADFRSAFLGARRTHLLERRLLDLAEKTFGPDAPAKIQAFLEGEAYSRGADRRSQMSLACRELLAQVEAGGMTQYAARRRLQTQLADAGGIRAYKTSLRRRSRQYIQDEFGVANRFWNYLPLRFQRSWLPIRRNPRAQLSSGLSSMSNVQAPRALRFIPNNRIPAGSNFQSAWPLEYSASSFWGGQFSRLGMTAILGGAFSFAADSLLIAAHYTGPAPDAATGDPEKDAILRKLFEEQASAQQIQAWSLHRLFIDLKALELEVSLEQRSRGFPPVQAFLDVASAFLPEKFTNRVSSVYVIFAPVQRLGGLSSESLDQAWLIRFDSVWEPESGQRPGELTSASWKLAEILDISKVSPRSKQIFEEAIRIEGEGISIDPKEAGGLSARNPQAIIFQASEL